MDVQQAAMNVFLETDEEHTEEDSEKDQREKDKREHAALLNLRQRMKENHFDMNHYVSFLDEQLQLRIAGMGGNEIERARHFKKQGELLKWNMEATCDGPSPFSNDCQMQTSMLLL